MTDGSTFSGDIIKADDNGVMLRAGDTYTNLLWGRFSQGSLKQLAANPKFQSYVEVFIDPDMSQRPAAPKIHLNPVKRMKLPANPSFLGGLVSSSLGLFILLLVYVANLYAGFEVAVIRARPPMQVIGVSALLPLIGPALFLWLPIKEGALSEESAEPLVQAVPSGQAAGTQDIQVVDVSWKQEETKKVEYQVFARGKFTFNKRFIETKFGSYIGVPKADALKFTMEAKTPKGQFTVERIAQVGATDVIFETVQSGQVTVPFSDILEITLIPKTA